MEPSPSPEEDIDSLNHRIPCHGWAADGGYPDFALLEEVLLPPYFESDTCSTEGDLQSEAITLLAQSQYQQRPLDATVALNDCEQATKPTLQYRRHSSRGRKKRSANNRSPSVKVGNWCQLGNQPKIKEKMSCMIEPEPSIIYLLEESMKKLPKSERNLEDDQVSKSSCSINEDHLENLSVKNGYRMTPCSSAMTSNAMELLHLINMKCTRLNAFRGDHLRIEDVDHQQRDDSRGGGYAETMKDNILNSNAFSLASANKVNKTQDTKQGAPIKHGGLLSEDHNLRTSVSSVESDQDQTGECSSLNTSTDSEVSVRKTPRKQRHPTKGVEKQDPSFRGIEFQMQLYFEKETHDECRLVVTPFYSRGRSRRKSTKSRLRFKSTSLSSGSEEDQTPANSSKNKRCASCKTQKTPLWRDAEDGTPLCNACGIRYKKYGIRCGQCWHIPKKDGKSGSKYCGCGGMFRAPV